MPQVDEDETRTTSDRILSGVSNLKSKLADLNSDQNELKLGMRTMRSLMSEVRNESRQSAEVCIEIRRKRLFTPT